MRRSPAYDCQALLRETNTTVKTANQAERDIRMIRLQQKISTSWRAEHGIDDFLTVRSYLSTARKHRRNGLEVLRELFTTTPWLPAPT